MKKILIVQTRHIESISYLTAELVNAFPAEEYQVTLAYLEAGEPSATDRLAHECYFLGLNKTDYKGLRLKAIKKLRPFFEQHQFDVVIANMYKPVHLLMQLGRSISAPVCIGIIHAFGEFDRPMRRWGMRWMLDSRWMIVGVSDAVRSYLINARCGLREHNTYAINNALDVNAAAAAAMTKSEARALLNLPADGLIFGTIGRCVKGKRHLELIQAFEQFAAQKENVFLAIIGDGELYPQLKSYVNQRNLADKVRLVGYIDQAARVVRALDVFMFPSESEGFGLALLEAMAASVPAIVHNVEPLRGIVAGCGDAVDCADITAMSNAMNTHYALTSEARGEKGSAHFQRVLTNYDIKQYRGAYRSLVERLIGATPCN